MCRYSDQIYKTSWVCLKHRHVAQYVRSSANEKPLCPTCRQVMIDMGRDFAAPRKESDNQWRKLELLVAAGVRFDSCGCSGPGPRPHTLAQAKQSVQ